MRARLLSPHKRLLLNAALNPDAAVAVASWRDWLSQMPLEQAPLEDLRLLPAIYAHLRRVAPELELPNKLLGKARANFTRNNLLAHGSLPAIEELARHCPVMLTKGLAICIRFDAWSSRTMADVDVHIPLSALETASRALARVGWMPDYGMTMPSLLHRASLRRNSWNFSKGPISVDLHWRLRDVPASDRLARQMWASGEQVEFSGTPLLLQSPEFAFASSLHHGLSLGSPANALQTLVDTAWLLPRCDIGRLRQVLRDAQLLRQLDLLVSIFAGSGLGDVVPSELAGRAGHGTRVGKRIAGAARNRLPLWRKERTETSLLRHPMLYRAWSLLGKRPVLERLLIRLTGPLSRPLVEPTAPAADYDLTDCRTIDMLGGPGWAWPQRRQSYLWSDRSDARLLIPLEQIGDHLLALSFFKLRQQFPNRRIEAFANGSFVGTIEFGDDMANPDCCLLIRKTALWGPWVELSLRPKPYAGRRARGPDDYRLTRSLPVRRLRVLNSEQILKSSAHIPEMVIGQQ